MSPEQRWLLDEIARETRETAPWTGRSHISKRVMAAIAAVPRDAFVLPDDRKHAWENRPLAIGHGQTISQPFIVAIMTELLDLEPHHRVLEVGTGSGYQAAVLAEVAGDVFSVEIVSELAAAVRTRLDALGYGRIDVAVGDGWRGRSDVAPFDAIIVTAAPVQIPHDLIDQLKPGGRLVIPTGPAKDTQMLHRCVRRSNGQLACEDRLPVAFVPLVRGL